MSRKIIMLLCLLLLSPLGHAATKCANRTGEDFNRFMDRFAVDRPFSQGRTLYPLSVLRAEYGTDDVKYIETQRSALEDKGLPGIQELRSRTGLVSKVSSLEEESATVELFKPDTDWLMTYSFERHTGCWYLKQIKDLSL